LMIVRGMNISTAAISAVSQSIESPVLVRSYYLAA
jgi:hypothetical protein